MYSRPNPINLTYFFLLTAAILSAGPVHAGDSVKDMADKAKALHREGPTQKEINYEKITRVLVEKKFNPNGNIYYVIEDGKKRLGVITIPPGTPESTVREKTMACAIGHCDPEITNKVPELTIKLGVLIKNSSMVVKPTAKEAEIYDWDYVTLSLTLDSCPKKSASESDKICGLVINTDGSTQIFTIDEKGAHF